MFGFNDFNKLDDKSKYFLMVSGVKLDDVVKVDWREGSCDIYTDSSEIFGLKLK